MINKPPYLSQLFLKWFCTAKLIEEIEGDLYEEFMDNSERYGNTKARMLYSWTVLRSVRPYLIKTFKRNKYRLNPFDMFKNYLKIALRNLVKQKGYTLTNVLGLTIGIISVFMILIFIDSETHYDQHHDDYQNLYRVVTSMSINGEDLNLASSPPGLADRLKSDFAEIEDATRMSMFIMINKNLLQMGDKQFFETEGFFADSAYFRMFKYDFIYGSQETALDGPQKIVLSKTLYNKFFSDEDPVGKTLTIANNHGKTEYQITGVFSESKFNSHVNPQFICSMNSGVVGRFIYNSDEMLGNNFVFTYLKLKPETSKEDFEAKLPAFLEKYIGENLKKAGATKDHQLQNVADIHLYSSLQGEAGTNSSAKYIYMLLSIAVFILVIACINFMNMATAQSAHRAREIGVRKVFGAYKTSLIYQFLGEAAVITFFSIFLSVIGIYLALPYFNQLVGRVLVIDLTSNIQQLGLIIGLGVITSFLAGCYPAFYLSSMKTINVVKGIQKKSKGGFIVRKGLVVFQYIIAIALIIGALTINSQMNFIQSKSLGFQKENKLIIPLQSAEGIKQYSVMKTQIESLSGIKSVAGVNYYPGEFVLNDNLFHKEGNTIEQGVRIQANRVDYGLLETLGIELISGRTFDINRPSDINTSVILNETAINAVGYTPEEAIGRKIYAMEDTVLTDYTIIGVSRDFNFMSLHEEIGSYMFGISPDNAYPYIIVDTETTDFPGLVKNIEDRWKATLPGLPFEYLFLDNQMQKLYDGDRNFAQIIGTFTSIAIVICCLGLFGLSAFTAEQRIKEIGVRKVLGASVPEILLMLNKNFSLLVLLAFIFAAPLGWYFMNNWLDAFAFRINIGAGILLTAGLVTLVFTLIVVSYQSLRAATTNPVNTLRNE